MIDSNLAIVVAAAIGAGGVVLGTMLTTVTTLISDALGSRRVRRVEEMSERRSVIQELIAVMAAEGTGPEAHEPEWTGDRSDRFYELFGRLALFVTKREAVVLRYCLTSWLCVLKKGNAAHKALGMVHEVLPAWHRGEIGTTDVQIAYDKIRHVVGEVLADKG